MIIGSFGTRFNAEIDFSDKKFTLHLEVERRQDQVQHNDGKVWIVTGTQRYTHGVFLGVIKPGHLVEAFQDMYPDRQVTVDQYRQAAFDDMPYHRVFVS
jgi:hypothetical protein